MKRGRRVVCFLCRTMESSAKRMGDANKLGVIGPGEEAREGRSQKGGREAPGLCAE